MSTNKMKNLLTGTDAICSTPKTYNKHITCNVIKFYQNSYSVTIFTKIVYFMKISCN